MACTAWEKKNRYGYIPNGHSTIDHCPVMYTHLATSLHSMTLAFFRFVHTDRRLASLTEGRSAWDLIQAAWSKRNRTRLFTKTQICSSCFGSTNLGHSASFKSSDGLFYLDVWLWFSFPPLILSFHRPCAPRQPRWSLSHYYFGRDPSHSMHLANEFGLTALASVSSSRPPQFGICCCR